MATNLDKIKIKNSSITKIFETMEYGPIRENIKEAKAWLENNYVKGVVPEDLNSFILDKKHKCDWSNKPSIEKCFAIERFAKEVERNSSLICQIEMVGRELSGNDSKKSLPLLIDYLQYYVHWPIKIQKKKLHQGLVFVIVDNWCFLGMLGSVLGPALAAGCNIILHTEPKVSAITSLLIQLAERAGIPKGTLSHIEGDLSLEKITDHVDVLSFPGSFNSPKFKEVQFTNLKKIVGVSRCKSPMLVFNNADLDSACDSVVDAAWGYGAILPCALDKIFVQEDMFQTFTDKLKDRLSKVDMRHVLDKCSDVTYPLIEDALKKLQKTLSTAKSYGIEIFQKDASCKEFQPTILIGGKVFVNNVILEDDDSMVVSVMPFRTTNEGVNLANNTRYGLGVSVWTENIGLANEVTGKLNFSNVWINSYGNFSASAPFSPYKDSGRGFIGGLEGLCEYIYCMSPSENSKKEIKSVHAEGQLLQSFYGGAFRKSESGVRDGVFDVPVAKDLFNAVVAASKGFEVWKKETTLHRSQVLRQLALELEHNKEFISKNAEISETVINAWIEFTYETFSHLCNGNVTLNKTTLVETVKEPLGVITINETNKIVDSFSCIMASLILGNSIIIFNYDTTYAKFYTEICKILTLLKFPAGVFNVILNWNQELSKNVAFHKEIIANFVLSGYSNDLGTNKMGSFKQVYLPMDDWIMYLSKVKNIWCNVGDSVV